MKCRKCGKNNAGFYISWGDGFGSKIGFCESCAEEAGIFAALRRVESLMHGFGPESGGLFSPEDMSAPVEFADQCRSCGTSLREFERRFLFGCEECAIVFGSLISNYLTLLGANADGKYGFFRGEPPSCFSERAKLQALQNKIKEKIEREDYKGAAKHRDTYNALEKKLDSRRKRNIKPVKASKIHIRKASPASTARLILDTRELPDIREYWLASHVEVRRNFADFKFPSKSDKALSEQVRNHAFGYISRFEPEAEILEISDLTPVGRLAFGERFFRRKLNPQAAAIIGKDNGFITLINDTDHISFCSRETNRNGKKILCSLQKHIGRIEKETEIAFSPRFGFITTSPRHIGTGLTASVLLHLPHSFFRGRTLFWPENTDALSVRLDPFCGKSLEHHGFYRVSSSVGFGRSAEEIVSEVFDYSERLAAEQIKMKEDMKPSEIKRIKNIMPRVLDHATKSYRLAYRDVLRLTTFLALGVEHGAVELPGFSLDDVIPLLSSPFIMYRDGAVYSINQCEKRRADLFAELVEKWSAIKKTPRPAQRKTASSDRG